MLAARCDQATPCPAQDEWQSVGRKKAPQRAPKEPAAPSAAAPRDAAPAAASRAGGDGHEPSPRLWLRDLLPTTTTESLRVELARWGAWAVCGGERCTAWPRAAAPPQCCHRRRRRL